MNLECPRLEGKLHLGHLRCCSHGWKDCKGLGFTLNLGTGFNHHLYRYYLEGQVSGCLKATVPGFALKGLLGTMTSV